MRTPITAAIALLMASTAGPGLFVATADGAAPTAQTHSAGNELRFTFDNGESLRPGTVVRDVSGHRNRGRVVVGGRGRLAPDQGLVKRGADYPAKGRAIIEARDRRTLDPGRHPFKYGAAVKVTPRQVRAESNVVQKGFFSQPGGQWKLQLDRVTGRPSCVVNGSRGRVITPARVGIADGRWHRLECRRTRGAVSVRVDGQRRGRVFGSTGVVANAAPVRVGGSKTTRGNDQFRGDLDSVFFDVKR